MINVRVIIHFFFSVTGLFKDWGKVKEKRGIEFIYDTVRMINTRMEEIDDFCYMKQKGMIAALFTEVSKRGLHSVQGEDGDE